MKEEVVRLMNDKDQLQADLITEQKKNEAEKYRKQVETL